MDGLIAGLAGAGGAANTSGGYYQDALNKEVGAYGSPAAQKFAQEYTASLKPGFQQQQQGLLGQLNATGIANSGAAKASLSNLYGQQSGQEAAGVAPLYQEGLQGYTGILSQEPGAQNQAYQQAINNFYAALNQAGAFAGDAMGVPSSGGGPAQATAANSSTSSTTSANPYAEV